MSRGDERREEQELEEEAACADSYTRAASCWQQLVPREATATAARTSGSSSSGAGSDELRRSAHQPMGTRLSASAARTRAATRGQAVCASVVARRRAQQQHQQPEPP